MKTYQVADDDLAVCDSAAGSSGSAAVSLLSALDSLLDSSNRSSWCSLGSWAADSASGATSAGALLALAEDLVERLAEFVGHF